MERLDKSNILVQKLFYSKRADGFYKFAPQRKGIGTIDLRGIKGERQFFGLWKGIIGMKGDFSFQLIDRKTKRFGKCLGIIHVDETGITFKDRRCSLATMIKENEREGMDKPI